MKSLIFLLLAGVSLAAHVRAAGELLADLNRRHQQELSDLNDRYAARNQLLSDEFGEAYARFMKGKGTYPAELSRKFNDLEEQRQKEFSEVEARHRQERQAVLDKEAGSVGPGDGAARFEVGGASSSQQAPPVSSSRVEPIDGSKVPKEIEFPAPSSVKGGGR